MNPLPFNLIFIGLLGDIFYYRCENCVGFFFFKERSTFFLMKAKVDSEQGSRNVKLLNISVNCMTSGKHKNTKENKLK